MLYTVGYTGWKLPMLQQTVADLGAALVDIRYTPDSRWPAWKQPCLQTTLGTRYHYVHALGNRNYKGGCALSHKSGSCPLLVKRGSWQICWRFWVGRGEGQSMPFLGKTSSALRVSVAILMASPKVGKNQDYVASGFFSNF